MRELFRRIGTLFRRRHGDGALDEEVRLHLDLLAADYERRGMTPAQARYAARRAFGGVEPMKERYRDRRGLPWLEDLGRDLRYGLRTMRKRPGLSIVAAVTLALGIGANTALFSVINAVMLTPLPVPRPGDLRLFSTTGGPTPVPGFSFSYPVYEDLQRDARAFAGVALYGRLEVRRLRVGASPEATGASGDIERVGVQAVSGTFFSVLGVLPAAGRLLVADDDRPDTATAVVMSERFWSRRFGRDPDVIGRRIVINDVPFTIVGVAAAGFTGVQVGEHPDIWWPSRAGPRLAGGDPMFGSRAIRNWRLIGRLAPGADPRQAEAQARAVFEIERQEQITRTAVRFGGTLPPEEMARIQQPQMRLQPGGAGFTLVRWQFRQPLLVLMALVVLVLLIACANVANLLLARATARRQEMAVRMALGSGRGRVIRQMLTESTLIAGAGALLGTGIAVAGTRLVTSFLNSGEITIAAGPDRRVFAFTMAVSLLAAFVAGLLPAVASTRVDLARRDARGTASRGRLTVHHGIVGAQVALSIVVLVTAGLFLRSLVNLQRVDTGFEPDRLTMAAVDLPASHTPERRLAVQRAVLDRLGSAPGQQAALSTFGVLSGLGWGTGLDVPGRAVDPAAAVNGLLVSSAFFDVTGTRLIAGRGFSADHDYREEEVAVVNETTARRFFGGTAVGQRFRMPGPFPKETFTVIGVVADSTYRNVRDEAGAALPLVYFPLLAGPGARMARGMNGVQIGVRTALMPDAEASIRAAIRQVEPAAIVGEVRAMREVIQDTMARETLLAQLGAWFGVVALVLGAIGIYGVRAYAVNRRVAEFGLRLALGATPGQVLRRVIAQGAMLAATGVAAGLVAAAIATRLVRTLLFDVTPLDVSTFAAAAAIFGGVAIVASYLPARRAMRIDPAAALRAE
jgi:predicted permease